MFSVIESSHARPHTPFVVVGRVWNVTANRGGTLPIDQCPLGRTCNGHVLRVTVLPKVSALNCSSVVRALSSNMSCESTLIHIFKYP